MAGIMTTKAAKWETTAWAAIRDDMKGVFLQDGDVHRETAWKEQSQMEGRERKWERKKKGRKGERRERERGRQSRSRIDRFATPSPTTDHLLHCVWKLWSTRAFERELKGSVLIKYSFSVKLARHHSQPLTTSLSLSPLVYKIKWRKYNKHTLDRHWNDVSPTHAARSHLEVVDEPRVVELALFSVDRLWVDVHLPISLGVHLCPEKR